MSKASEQELAEMHGVIARGLTEVLREGVTVGSTEDGQPIKATAGAAYFAAAIAFAKNNNITADAGTNADLQALTEALAAKRKGAKARLSPTEIDQAATVLDRELGGVLMQ
jgi:hypothetical protein